eukprot:6603624-Pyramimonas_sp.AAC.1
MRLSLPLSQVIFTSGLIAAPPSLPDSATSSMRSASMFQHAGATQGPVSDLMNLTGIEPRGHSTL